MHSFWKRRIWIYLLIALTINTTFCDRPSVHGPLMNQAGFYIGFYGSAWIIWTLFLELFYWIVRGFKAKPKAKP